jgi:hypothetical protein
MERFVKSKLILALLSIALLPNASFAKRLDDAEQTPTLGHAVLADAHGTMIGDAQSNVSTDSARVYFGFNEKHYYAQLEREWFNGFYLYYDGLGCTGNAYVRKPQVESSIEPLEALRDGIFYITDSDVRQTVTIVSVWEEFHGKTACDDLATSPPIDVYPAVPLINTNVYTKPYQLKLILAK